MNKTHCGDRKVALDRRLGRIEGQVRGIRRMIVVDRYCLNVIQQRELDALTAAAREVTLLVLEDHLRATIADAMTGSDGEAAIQETITVLRKALRS